MNPKLTDDAVADLPLHHGRAELLEEIMRTPVLDDRPVRAERPRRVVRRGSCRSPPPLPSSRSSPAARGW